MLFLKLLLLPSAEFFSVPRLLSWPYGIFPTQQTVQLNLRSASGACSVRSITCPSEHRQQGRLTDILRLNSVLCNNIFSDTCDFHISSVDAVTDKLIFLHLCRCGLPNLRSRSLYKLQKQVAVFRQLAPIKITRLNIHQVHVWAKCKCTRLYYVLLPRQSSSLSRKYAFASS